MAARSHYSSRLALPPRERVEPLYVPHRSSHRRAKIPRSRRSHSRSQRSDEPRSEEVLEAQTRLHPAIAPTVPLSSSEDNKETAIPKIIPRLQVPPFQVARLRYWGATDYSQWQRSERDLWCEDGDVLAFVGMVYNISDQPPKYRLRSEDLLRFCSAYWEPILKQCQVPDPQGLVKYHLAMVMPNTKDPDKYWGSIFMERNALAVLLCTKAPLLGYDQHEILVLLVITLNRWSGNGAHNADLVADHLSRLGVLNIANDPAKATLLLAWCEHASVRHRQYWSYAFHHCMGMYHQLPNIAQHKHISESTKTQLYKTAKELDHRITLLEELLENFIWPPFLKMKFSKRGKYALSGYTSLAKKLPKYLKKRHGGKWPPAKLYSGHWLSKSRCEELLKDFCCLYEFLVDPDVYLEACESRSGPRFVMKHRHKKDFDGNSPVFPMLDMLTKYDNHHGYSHLPMPYCLVPPEDGLQKTRKKSKQSDIRKREFDFVKYTNAERETDRVLGNHLVKQYSKWEAEQAANKKCRPHDERRGAWLLVYCIAQALSSVQSTMTGIPHSKDARYHMCPAIPMQPFWEEKASCPVTLPLATYDGAVNPQLRGWLVWKLNHMHSNEGALPTAEDIKELPHDSFFKSLFSRGDSSRGGTSRSGISRGGTSRGQGSRCYSRGRSSRGHSSRETDEHEESTTRSQRLEPCQEIPNDSDHDDQHQRDLKHQQDLKSTSESTDHPPHLAHGSYLEDCKDKILEAVSEESNQQDNEHSYAGKWDAISRDEDLYSVSNRSYGSKDDTFHTPMVVQNAQSDDEAPQETSTFHHERHVLQQSELDVSHAPAVEGLGIYQESPEPAKQQHTPAELAWEDCESDDDHGPAPPIPPKNPRRFARVSSTQVPLEPMRHSLHSPNPFDNRLERTRKSIKAIGDRLQSQMNSPPIRSSTRQIPRIRTVRERAALFSISPEISPLRPAYADTKPTRPVFTEHEPIAHASAALLVASEAPRGRVAVAPVGHSSSISPRTDKKKNKSKFPRAEQNDVQPIPPHLLRYGIRSPEEATRIIAEAAADFDMSAYHWSPVSPGVAAFDQPHCIEKNQRGENITPSLRHTKARSNLQAVENVESLRFFDTPEVDANGCTVLSLVEKQKRETARVAGLGNDIDPGLVPEPLSLRRRNGPYKTPEATQPQQFSPFAASSITASRRAGFQFPNAPVAADSISDSSTDSESSETSLPDDKEEAKSPLYLEKRYKKPGSEMIASRLALQNSLPPSSPPPAPPTTRVSHCPRFADSRRNEITSTSARHAARGQEEYELDEIEEEFAQTRRRG